MSISSEFIAIIEEISEQFKLPDIKEIISPQNPKEAKNSNFSAIILEDNTVGLIFINLSPKIKQKFTESRLNEYKGSELISLIGLFESADLFERSIGLGCINAISQFFFKKVNFSFDFTTDSLGLLEINNSDVVGMVGFFPPLVKVIEKIGSRLIIIEKKEELVQDTPSWTVTLDPSKLRECNKVLITGTTVLNETIDDILLYCTNIEKASVIGPTASFLPDPLFNRGIDVIGGTYIVDPKYLDYAIQNGIRWSESVKKYTIKKESYPGYKKLISGFL